MILQDGYSGFGYQRLSINEEVMKKLVTLILFLPTFIYAEPIKFSGSTSIYVEYDTLYGISQQRPSRTLRWRLNPTLTIYGMPLSLNLFLTTEESNLRQTLDKFSIFLNPSRLLREFVDLPGLVFSIGGIGVGTCYPSYSKFTLSGIPVTGGEIEFNPGLFYLAATGGRTQRAVEGSDTTEAAYKRMLYSGKFGVGKKDKNHIYFTILHAKDDQNSISPYTVPILADTLDTLPMVDSIEAIAPRENYVAGIELKLSLFDNKFSLESEMVGSELTHDVRSAEIPTDIIPIPSWIVDIVHPKISSSFDYAYSVKAKLNLMDTRVYGSIKMVGPGFVSLGTSYLRNDNYSYEAGIDKRLLNNTVSLAAIIVRDRDNLINWKNSTTSNTSYNFNMNLTPRALPYLRLSYTPYFQRNDELNIDNRTDILSLSTGHSYPLRGIDNYSNLYFSYQGFKQKVNINNYTSLNLLVSHSLSFQFPLSISGNAGLTQTKYNQMTSRILSLDISSSYNLWREWSNTVGFNWSGESENHKYCIFLDTSFPLWKIGNMDFKIEKSFYRDVDKTENYDELRLRTTLSRSW